MPTDNNVVKMEKGIKDPKTIDDAKQALADSKRGDPVCPHCSSDPLLLSALTTTVGVYKTIVMYCGIPECRKVITTQIVGQEQQRIIPAGRT